MMKRKAKEKIKKKLKEAEQRRLADSPTTHNSTSVCVWVSAESPRSSSSTPESEGHDLFIPFTV